MRQRTSSLLALCATFVSLAVGTTARAQPTAEAVLDSHEIALGQITQLEVTVSGVSSSTPPRVPPIDGLEIANVGQIMNVEIVNGQTTSQVTHSFQVRPTRTGQFTIPSLTIQATGRTLSTSPLTLLVVASGSRARRAPSQAGEARRPAQERDAEPSEDPVFLRVRGIPDRPLYVGEVIPVNLQLYVRDGARVTQATPPQVQGNGFTLGRPPEQQPRQEIVREGDRRYVRLTFPAALSPIKTGDLELGLSLEVTALVPERRRSRYFGDPLFDSFLDPFSFGRGVERKFPIESPKRKVRVVSLPEQGRPASFSGAVGRFTLSAEASPKRVKIGDPVTLEVTVAGKGSFDRLRFTPMESNASWKAYDPSSRFETKDELGIDGKKIFEQAVLPLRVDLHGVPAMELSYFDPDQRRYVTLSSAAIPLEILPGAGGTRSATIGGSVGDALGGAPSDELAPNHVEIGRLHRDLRPIMLSPWFVALQALPLALLGATLFWVRRRTRLEADPTYLRDRAARREVRSLVGRMRKTVAERDARGFFEIARRAIQEGVAGRTGAASASSLTLAELEQHLAAQPETQQAVREIFEAADRVSYGGYDERSEELADWQAKVERALAALRASGRR